MIRPFNVNDLKKYMEMAEKFYDSSAVDHKVSSDNFLITFNECINKSPYCNGFIIEYEGITVGYALISITYSNEVAGKVILLEELYIESDYRSNGLGKEFFEFIYRNYPAKRYRLEVTSENNRAAELYKRLGFKELNYIQMIKD